MPTVKDGIEVGVGSWLVTVRPLEGSKRRGWVRPVQVKGWNPLLQSGGNYKLVKVTVNNG